MQPLQHLEERLRPLYARLAKHPLYTELASLAELHCFMEAHVFAVWDFMSLLKALQRALTCVQVPWMPSPLAESRRLVNEIVLGEESDIYDGRALSHFELYLLAMQRAGADTSGIVTLLNGLTAGRSVDECLRLCPDKAAAAFVRDTFTIIDQGKPHAIAAAFTFGREDLIPDLFQSFVRALDRQQGGQLDVFLWYLNRHIEVDGEEHGPMARRMVAELCGDDLQKWAEAEAAAVFAVESRLRLWDGVLATVRARRLQRM